MFCEFRVLAGIDIECLYLIIQTNTGSYDIFDGIASPFYAPVQREPAPRNRHVARSRRLIGASYGEAQTRRVNNNPTSDGFSPGIFKGAGMADWRSVSDYVGRFRTMGRSFF